MPVVTFSQSLHAEQSREESSKHFATYKDACDAILAYFRARLGRYPNEVITVRTQREFANPLVRTPSLLESLAAALKTYETPVAHGKEYTIYLELDGTTHFGMPILQTVVLSEPDRVAAARDAARAERLETYGRACYCGSLDCDWDCGTLSCGCIDACRGRCGCSDSDDDYF